MTRATFNPFKARDNKKRSQVNVLTERSVKVCETCEIPRRMKADQTVCDVCELGEQDFGHGGDAEVAMEPRDEGYGSLNYHPREWFGE